MAISRHNLVPDLPDNNFATLNTLLNSGVSMSDGNLGFVGSSSWKTIFANFLIPTTGKWYWEIQASGTNTIPGIAAVDQNLSGNLTTYPADGLLSYGYYGNGQTRKGPGNTGANYADGYNIGDIIGIILDMNAKTIGFYKNNDFQGIAFSNISEVQYVPVFGVFDAGKQIVNFGQNPDFSGGKTNYSGGDNPDGSWSDATGIGRFHHQPPAGALALCSRNLQPAVSFRGYDFEETGKALTYNGDAKISKNSPYMGGSSKFGSSSWFEIPNNGFTFGSKDFCIEGWFKTDDSNRMPIFHGSNGQDWSVGIDYWDQTFNMWAGSSGSGWSMIESDSTGASSGRGTTIVKPGQWAHIAYTRSGNDFRIFVNGHLDKTLTASGSIANEAGNNTKALGSWFNRSGAGGYFRGQMADVRVILEDAVYTESFTPPSEPLVKTDKTVFLLSSKTGTDIARPDRTTTYHGSINFVPTSPLNTPSKQRENALTGFGGGSFELDGSSYIKSGYNLDFNSNFTIQGWFYTTSSSGSKQCIFSCNRGDAEGIGMLFSSGAKHITFYVGESGSWVLYELRTPDNTILANKWNYFIVTWDGTTYKLSVNGSDPITKAGNAGSTTANELFFGRWRDGDTSYFSGFMSDIRIIRGTALTDYTVPNSKLSFVENTTFLAQPYRMKSGVGNMSIASRPSTDETGKLLTYNGNVSTSTQSPVSGLGSFEFNQSGLTFEQSVLQGGAAFGTGDFTIEFWLYMDDIMSQDYWCLCDTRTGGGDADAFGFFMRGNNETPNGAFYVYANGNNVFGQVAKDRTWHHVALVRESNSLNCFLDGNPGSPVTFTNNLSATNDFTIGWPPFNPTRYRLNGKMSDIRVVKGEALYTSNFNPFNRPASADISTGTVVLDLSPKASLSAAENPKQHFKAVTYVGNGTAQSIDVGFQPDLVWGKSRTGNIHNCLFDSVRGVGAGRCLTSDITDGETSRGQVDSFDSNGFSVSGYHLNDSSFSIVAWCWKAAGAPADNTANIIDADGSLITMPTADLKTSTGASITPAKVSANCKSGFSIVKYIGDGNTDNSSPSSVPSGLNSVDFAIVKNLDYGNHP